MKRFMIDIESAGAQPGGVILSIGWCRFSLDGVYELEQAEFRIDIQDQLDHGLIVDGSTLNWWLEQPGKPWHYAKAIRFSMVDALNQLCAVFKGADEVWAKPPSYDLAAIYHAMRVYGIKPSWGFRSERCFRTLKHLTPPGVTLPTMEGQKHGALDDAIQQAHEAIVILKALRR